MKLQECHWPIGYLLCLNGMSFCIDLEVSVGLFVGYIHLLQDGELWLEGELEKMKSVRSQFLLSQQLNMSCESSFLFEGERIEDILAELVTLYSEWIGKLSEARQWFAEGIQIFYAVKTAASFIKGFCC
jgi:hypothetical protein